MPEIIVIGAGISGLTAAYQLAKVGKHVLVLESSDAVGGKIQSERIEGYLLEAGPNSLRIENQETIDLIEELGLSSRIVEASPNAKKRFILKNGNWIQVPANPKEAITTSLFSGTAKLRVGMEPFLSKANAEDETVKSFISRRLGTELFDYAADPFITGIYAGDPSKLSMRYAFPALWNAEQTSGSLIKGMLKARKSKSEVRVKRSVISFPNGLSELTDALREVLKDRIEFLNGAADLNRSTSRFQVSSSRMLEAERVVCTLPAYEASGIVSPLSPELSVRLRSIEYSPVAVAFLGYRNNQFTNIPEGFGGLIPSKEHRTILGIIFSSSNFPNRAPKDHSLITVMMGGALHREIENQSENNILEIAKKEVCDLLRPDGEPSFQDLQLWKRAIPQYNIGYGAVLESIVKVESDNPGLYFLGNYRGGISIGSCIRNATELAKRLV